MDTVKKSAKVMRSRIRDTRKWCLRPQPHLEEQCEQDIRKYLTKNDTTRAALNVGFRGFWYAQHGVRAVLDGEMQGWAQLDRSFHYLWLNAQVMSRKTQASVAASALANALVFGEEAMAEPLAAKLIQSLDDHKVFMVWIESAFATFMLKLWGLYRGQEINVVRPAIAPLRIYQRILDAWNDEAALANAIGAACDYHLEQTGEAGYAEFYFNPYTLFPADILVIGTIRRKLGLPMPEVFHPLLDTPLAKVPPAAERPRMGPDPLFEEVLARAKKDGLIP